MSEHGTEIIPAVPVFYGPAMVAQWCGVSRDAVSNWLRRHDDFPEPAGQLCGPERSSYFWRGDQRGDWLRWADATFYGTPE